MLARSIRNAEKIGAAKIKEFQQRQRRIRQALMITTMIVDERTATVDYLVQKYSLDMKTARSAMRVALTERLVKVATLPDGAEVFTFTNKGWRLVALTWIARHGVATSEYLDERFPCPQRQNLVQRFVEWAITEGLLRTGGTMRTEPQLIIATKEGLTKVGRATLGVCPVSERDEGHLRTLPMVGMRLELSHRHTHIVLTEREIFLLQSGIWKDSDFAQAGQSAETIAQPTFVDHKTGKEIRKRSDLLMQPRRAEHEWIAIEVELSERKKRETASHAIAWRDCETVGQAVYYCAPEVTPDLRRAFARALEGVAPSTQLEAIETGEPIDSARSARPRYKLSLFELPWEHVPAERRNRDYEPQEIPDSREYYLALGVEARQNLRSELLEKVEWIGWHGFTPVDAIATRYGLAEEDACHLLVLAHGAGWLEFTTMLREEGALFRISQHGRDELAKSLTPAWSTTYSLAGREATCSRVAAMLECEHPDRYVQGPIEIRTDHKVGGQPLLTVGGKGAALGQRRRPEMMLLPPFESHKLPHAVVIEPWIIAPHKVERIISAFGESEQVDRVLYFAAYAKVLTAARRAVTKLGLKGKVIVRPLPLSKQPLSDEPHKAPRWSSTGVSTETWKQIPIDQKLAPPCADAHEPLAEVTGFAFTGICDEAWEELIEKFPNLACEARNNRRSKICWRSSVNGMLYVMASGTGWMDLPIELGYGIGATCRARRDRLQAEGAWACLQEIIERREPDRTLDWARAIQRRQRKYPPTKMPASLAPRRKSHDSRAAGSALSRTGEHAAKLASKPRGRNCASESHEPLVADASFEGVGEQAWKEICKEFPQLACGPIRRNSICNRSALNGMLFVMADGKRWQDLPTDLGYGCALTCYRRHRKFHDEGIWPRLLVIIERCEPDRKIAWNHARGKRILRARIPRERPKPLTIPPNRCGSSHEPFVEVSEFPFWGIRDDTWAELLRRFPHLACGRRRGGRKGVCNRSALNGILYVFGSFAPWADLPPELGYGSASICYPRLTRFRSEGVWDCVREVITRREPDRRIDWKRVDATHKLSKGALKRKIETFPQIHNDVWRTLEPLFAEDPSSRKHAAICNRVILEGIACILLNEVEWKALGTGSGYGNHVTRRDRVRRWVATGVWSRARAELIKHEPYNRITTAQWRRFDGLLRQRAASGSKRRREELIVLSTSESQTIT